MLALLMLAAGGDTSGGGGTLDTQTVTSATTGFLGNQVRGYGGGTGGSISDGTSDIYSGAAITAMYVDQGAGEFYLSITGATNTGWTTMTNATDGHSLSRSAASFSGGTWTWAGQTLNGFFGANGAKTINFT